MAGETRYAKSGDVHIAYQVIGETGPDLVFVMGWASHLEYSWEEPSFARFLRRLASFSRLIAFDKRGVGLSDRVVDGFTLEDRMDDVRAVLDAVGSERAALVGLSEGATMCALFAATYPERTSALIMLGGFPRRVSGPEYPWGPTMDEQEAYIQQLARGWGTPVALAMRAPSVANDERFRAWWATFLRLSVSPGAAVALTRMNAQIDIRHVLPTIRVPTLIVHRSGDLAVPVEAARYMAERIPGATYVELPGPDHLPFVGDQDAILDEIERFVTRVQPTTAPDQVLATVLSLEIVGATTAAARLGSHRWTELLGRYRTLTAAELVNFRGREIATTGVGLLASFDGPARAIRCAMAIRDDARRLSLEIHAGLHTGACEGVGENLQGPAVQLAARVAAHAPPGEILVSGMVKDLVAGSGLRFEDLGDHNFGGLPHDWHLHRLSPGRGTDDLARAAGQRGEGETGQHAGRLSPREVEVARLVALGLSNRQIAEELVITGATAERHVANILAKLDFHARAQIAAWAVEQGLLRGMAARI